MKEQIHAIIHEILGNLPYRKNPEEFKDSVTFEQLGFDSLDMIDLILGIEEEFKIEVQEDNVKWKTIGDVIKYVEEKKCTN